MFAMLIAVLDKEIARCAREDEVTRRSMTIPDCNNHRYRDHGYRSARS